jgi:hypothetical protein
MRRVLLLAWLLASVALPVPASAQTAPALLDRAFTIAAEAFPVEPAPGANQTTLGIRPVASRAGATNPPADAFGRAAATDFGLIEAYTGPQGPSAEADTASANGQREAHVEQGGMTLDAEASTEPRGHAAATGNSSTGTAYSTGASSSFATADGSTRPLLAVAAAEVNDVVSGPLFIGSARFDASVSLDGTPGGAVAHGRVTATDATVSGIPVILDESGVRVDDAAVPATQLPTLTEAVRMALNRGGYIDVRVVQPVVEVAPDGTRASVRGGGVRIHMGTNDPSSNYFLELNLVAGSASVLLGTFIEGTGGGSGGAAPFAGSLPSGPVTRVGRLDGFDAVVPAAPPAPAAAAPSATGAPAQEAVVATAASTYRLASRWPGWPWLLAALALVGAMAASLRANAMAPVRLRLILFADRYLRG